jgi:hypothetical protein
VALAGDRQVTKALEPGRTKWARNARPPAKPVTPRRDRRVQGPLPGPVGALTTVKVLERTELDKDRLYLASWSPSGTEYDTIREHGRVFLESETAKPAWIIRWRALPPSQNEIMRKYADDHAYSQLIRQWQDVFWAAMTEAKIPKAGGRRRMEITRFIREDKFRLDRGNLVGGCKPLLDAAVRAGLLIDDREDHLDDQYRQAIDAASERTEILVYNL